MVHFSDVWKCVINGFSLRTDPGASASISHPLSQAVGVYMFEIHIEVQASYKQENKRFRAV